MRVVKQHRDGEIHVQLLDDDGTEIPTVSLFLRHLRARGCSPNTLLAYAHDLQRLFRFLHSAGLALGDFTPARALDFLVYLRDLPCRGKTGTGRLLAPTTVNRNLAAVSSFYEYMIVSDVLDGRENPVQKIPDPAAARVSPRYTPFLDLTIRTRPVRRVLRVRTAQRLPRPFPDDQLTALLGSLRKLRDRAMFLLMLQGDLRPGEVPNLHLEDIQYGRRRILIRHRTDHPKGVLTKSRLERVVDLHKPETLATLSAYVLGERPADAPTTHVFLVGGRGGNRHAPLGYPALIKLFRRRCARLGLDAPGPTPHALRHTHATRMWEGGMRELTLHERLGDASAESTRLYTRVSDAALIEDYMRVIGKKEKTT
jgi:integrase